MTQPEMIEEMCLAELSQADIKAIGHRRGFDAQTIGSRELMRHVFLSEQGVRAALASLAESEIRARHQKHPSQTGNPGGLGSWRT